MTIIYFFLFINLLIAIHECGHFLIAKLCRVKVLRFSLGVGKPLLRFYSQSGTEYRVCLIPFGGYVRLVEASFLRVSFFKKTLIILSGPFFNFLFAVLALWCVFVIGLEGAVPLIGQVQPSSIAWNAGLREDQKIIEVNQAKVYTWKDVSNRLVEHLGDQQPVIVMTEDLNHHTVASHKISLTQWTFDSNHQQLLVSLGIKSKTPLVPPVIANIIPHSPASRAGLMQGDRIVKINGQSIDSFEQVREIVLSMPTKTAHLFVQRRHQYLHINLLPEIFRSKEGYFTKRIGIKSKEIIWPKTFLYRQQFSSFGAIIPALDQTFSMTRISLHLMKEMVKGKFSWRNINGPISIAKGFEVSLSNGLVDLLKFLAFMSVSLGIVNLLPIPVLDGGYLVYHAAEYVMRKPMPHKIQITSVIIGWGLVCCLLLIAIINDLTRFLT